MSSYCQEELNLGPKRPCPIQLAAPPPLATPNLVSKIDYENLNANACNYRGNKSLVIYTQLGPLLTPMHNCIMVRESVLLVERL